MCVGVQFFEQPLALRLAGRIPQPPRKNDEGTGSKSRIVNESFTARLKTAALITLGCAKNLVDSEVMLGCLWKEGYRFTSDPAAADVVILNTCGFIRPAREEAEAEIQKLVRIKKRSPGQKLVVAGCYVEKSRALLIKKYPDVDLWTGVSDFNRIVRLVEGKPIVPSKNAFLYNHASPRAVSTPHSWAYIKISEGCSHRCSFCSIPSIKGRFRSRSRPSIIKEARILTNAGVREINLISQDTTYYGRDRGEKYGLAALLRDLLSVRQLEWVRILYGYPEEIHPPLLEVMKEKKICPYLDIPFQHASARILQGMKRGLDGPRALRLIDKIRKEIPDAALRTSLIVGFPGEGEREFRELAGFVRRARLDHLGVFTYSPEEGTAAAALGDPVPEKTKQARREEILEIQSSISRENNGKYIGRILDVLLEGPLHDEPGGWVGRTRYQAPEVDGVVLVKGGSPGRTFSEPIRKVEIVSADVYDLIGMFAG